MKLKAKQKLIHRLLVSEDIEAVEAGRGSWLQLATGPSKTAFSVHGIYELLKGATQVPTEDSGTFGPREQTR